MGCAGSKDLAVADVYRPPSTSFSLFDISAVEEPWLIATDKHNAANGDVDAGQDDDDEEEEEDDGDGAKKPITVVPLPLLEKLDSYELAPASWSEVSKALEDIKPTLNSKPPPKKKKKKQQQPAAQVQPPPPQKQQPSVAGTEDVGKKAPPPLPYGHGVEDADRKPPAPELTGRRAVKDNPFLMRDRENKNNDGAAAAAKWRRRDPFEGLRSVRRTFEDCERARQAVEACAEAAGGGVSVEERDVSLHGEYLRELRELSGEGAPPPRLFVMGRYLGGAEQCAELAESGKLREMLRWARARGEACAAKDGRGCEGCGGARFVPCLECGGSCKVVAGGGVERCGKCNENGLMMCPICH